MLTVNLDSNYSARLGSSQMMLVVYLGPECTMSSHQDKPRKK